MTMFSLVDCFLAASLGLVVCIFNLRDLRSTPQGEHVTKTEPYDKFAKAKYVAEYEFVSGRRSENVPSNSVIGDGHRHTLVIEFPYNKAGSSPLKIQINVSQNDNSPGNVIEPRAISKSEPKGSYFLVGYCAISEKYFSEDDKTIRYQKQVEILTRWVDYHLMRGFDHMTIYLDLSQPADEFVNLAQSALSGWIKEDKVSFLVWIFENRQEFLFQMALGMHAMERFRSHTIWFAPFDVDEYFESRLPALPEPKSIRDTITHIVDNYSNVSVQPSTIQVKSQFWGHKENKCHMTTNVSSFTEKAPGYLLRSRQKCFFRTDSVKYYSVHEPTTYPGEQSKNHPDPENVLRLNHFKDFGCLHVH